MASAAPTISEAQLYERNSNAVYRYCLRMLGSPQDAEDAAQTTFVQALRAMRRGVVPTFEQAWLLAIAKNECRSRHRANGRRRRLELVRDPQALAEVAEAPSGSDGTLIGVQQALTSLPETQRRALLLREWQGCSYDEIAHELETTVPAVEALLFRARRALARELGAEAKTKRRAFDVASLLAAVKSALGGGAAVKVAAGVVAVATVGSLAGSADETRAHGPEPPAVVPVRATVDEARRALARNVTSQRPRRAAADRGASSARAQQPGGARAARPGIRRGDEFVSPATPAAGAAPPAAKPDQPAGTPAEQSNAAPIAPAVTAIPTPTPPPAPSLPEVPSVPELPNVEVPQLPQVPELPELSEVPELLQVPLEVPEVPELSGALDLPSLP